MKLEMPLGQWAGIAVYDDVLDKEVCADLIKLVERHSIRLKELDILFSGKTVGGVTPSMKNSLDMHISPDMGDEMYALGDGWHEHDIHKDLVKCVNHYVNQYPGLSGHCWPLQDTGYQFQKYEVGHGKYDEHIDGGPFGTNFDRMLAIIIYLNDVNEGGETTFTRQGVSIKPVAGRVLVFPCHWLYPHRGEIPFDMDKYIITTFIMQESINHYINRPSEIQDHFHDHFREDLYHQDHDNL